MIPLRKKWLYAYTRAIWLLCFGGALWLCVWGEGGVRKMCYSATSNLVCLVQLIYIQPLAHPFSHQHSAQASSIGTYSVAAPSTFTPSSERAGGWCWCLIVPLPSFFKPALLMTSMSSIGMFSTSLIHTAHPEGRRMLLEPWVTFMKSWRHQCGVPLTRMCVSLPFLHRSAVTLEPKRW